MARARRQGATRFRPDNGKPFVLRRAGKVGFDAIALEGIAIQPETEEIDRKECPRWPSHKYFFALRFILTSSVVGQQRKATAVVEGKDENLLEASLQVDDVLPEPVIEVPETLEFRPSIATGSPGRRNNLVLYVNPVEIPSGRWVNVELHDRTGDVLLIDANGDRTERVDLKLDATQHKVQGQNVCIRSVNPPSRLW